MGKALDTAYWVGQSGGENTDGFVEEITETYFVLTAFGSEADTALAAAGLPINNAQHGTYTNLRVSKRSPTLQDNGIRWDIDITYTPVGFNDGGSQYRLVNIEYGTHAIQKDVTHNLGTGVVLTDANGKPFAGTIQAPVEYPFIKINKKEKTITRADLLNASGTINAAEVTVAGVVIPEHGGKIKIVASEVENEEYNWDVSYEVMVRQNDVSNYIDFAGALKAGPLDFGWDEGVINQGFYTGYVPGSGGPDLNRAMEKITLENGEYEMRPTAAPVLLDVDGVQLADGATPISIQVQTIRESDWSGLGLNNV